MPPVFASGDRRIHPTRCFVLMPFAAALKNVYAVLKSVVEDYAGCECVRADEIGQSSRITDDVYEQIIRARFLIADITGQNPNVYYELGLSHALAKEVIVLVQAGSAIPFDVRGIRYLEYSTEDLGELRKKLSEYIRRALQTVPEQWRTGLTDSWVGESGQPWKAKEVILDYPIAEVSLWKGQPVWNAKVTHSLTVEVVPERRGLIPFYISSSAFSAEGRHRLDPEDAPLLDQRDEPVYCGVIEVA
jgi:hypothetical protein